MLGNTRHPDDGINARSFGKVRYHLCGSCCPEAIHSCLQFCFYHIYIILWCQEEATCEIIKM